MNKSEQGIGLLFFLAISFLTSGLGGLFVYSSLNDWFARLNHPFFAPANGIFPLVWTILYTLIAVAVWLVWRTKPGKAFIPDFLLFVITLMLEVLWTAAFFYQHELFMSMTIIIAVLLSTILLGWQLKKTSCLAAGLIIPQVLWLIFASILNGAYWYLN